MNFLFYQYTALSSRALDGHQAYSAVSVVGKASTIGMEISPPTPPTGTFHVHPPRVMERVPRFSFLFDSPSFVGFDPFPGLPAFPYSVPFRLNLGVTSDPT